MSPILLEVNFLRWLNKSTLLLLVLKNHYGTEAFQLQQLQFLQIIEVHLLQENVPPIVLIVRLTQSSIKSMSLDSQAIAFLIAGKQKERIVSALDSYCQISYTSMMICATYKFLNIWTWVWATFNFICK